MERPEATSSAIERLRSAVHQRSVGRPGTFSVALDDKARSLVRLGAALTGNAPSADLSSLVRHAMTTTATEEDVIGTLLVVAPTIGAARVVATTPAVARAIGYDIEKAMESTEYDESGQD